MTKEYEKITRDKINLSRLSDASKALFKRLDSYPVDEKLLKQNFVKLNIDGEIVVLSNKQFALATHLSNDVEPLEAYVRAGYNWINRFSDKNRRNANNIKKNLLEDFKRMCLPKVTKICNYLKKGPLEELRIDKTWVLNEQVTLYNITKAEKQYTTAARLLDQIASHVDVDAKATNKVSIESNVDYATILAEAKKRTMKALEKPSEPKEITREPLEGTLVSTEEKRVH